jgi:hypothetical protein
MADAGQDVMVRVAERLTDATSSAPVAKSSRCSQQNVEEIEEEEEENCWADMLEGASYPELFSPGGCIKKDLGGCAMSPRLYQQATGTLSSLFVLQLIPVGCLNFFFYICHYNEIFSSRVVATLTCLRQAMSPKIVSTSLSPRAQNNPTEFHCRFVGARTVL